MVKNLAANAGHVRDVGSVPESRRSPGGREWLLSSVFLPGESRTEEPGRLQSMGSHRGGHNCGDLACTHRYCDTCIHMCVYQFFF